MRFEFVITRNDFPQAPALMRRAVGDGFAQAKGPLLASMQAGTPVDTGELRGSETAESDDASLTLRATAEHAIYVHQGTHKMPARPFMTDAIEAGLPDVVDAIAAAADRTLA